MTIEVKSDYEEEMRVLAEVGTLSASSFLMFKLNLSQEHRLFPCKADSTCTSTQCQVLKLNTLQEFVILLPIYVLDIVV